MDENKSISNLLYFAFVRRFVLLVTMVIWQELEIVPHSAYIMLRMNGVSIVWLIAV